MSSLPPPPPPLLAPHAWPPPQAGPPPPQQAWPPPPPARRRQPRIVVAISLLVVGVLAGGLFAFVSRGDSGPSHPDEWDTRITGLVRFVETHRGLEFEHPVFVDFLTADEYGERARADRTELSEDEKQELEGQAGQLRALGLATGDLDLFEVTNDLADAGTAAFYDPDTDRVSVRGTELTVEVKVTLVHELTHALQDQHFDIGSKRESSFETSGESSAFRALVEGDAVRIEDEYIQSLSEDEQAEFFESNTASVDESQAQLVDVPSALQALMAAPYVYGPPFTQLLFAAGGQEQVDEAFVRPPVDDEQQIDPRQFVHDRGPLEVDKPALPDGVEAETDSGDFGAIAWYLTLAERIPPLQALRATDGWGGDAYVAYEQSGRTCIRVAWRGDTDGDRIEMRDALDAWTAAMPGGSASVEADGEVLRLESCDPGTDSDIAANDRGLDALSLIEVRSYLTSSAVQDGDLSVDDGFDYGDCVVERVPFDILVRASTSAEGPPQVFFDALESCRP